MEQGLRKKLLKAVMFVAVACVGIGNAYGMHRERVDFPSVGSDDFGSAVEKSLADEAYLKIAHLVTQTATSTIGVKSFPQRLASMFNQIQKILNGIRRFDTPSPDARHAVESAFELLNKKEDIIKASVAQLTPQGLAEYIASAEFLNLRGLARYVLNQLDVETEQVLPDFIPNPKQLGAKLPQVEKLLEIRIKALEEAAKARRRAERSAESLASAESFDAAPRQPRQVQAPVADPREIEARLGMLYEMEPAQRYAIADDEDAVYRGIKNDYDKGVAALQERPLQQPVLGSADVPPVRVGAQPRVELSNFEQWLQHWNDQKEIDKHSELGTRFSSSGGGILEAMRRDAKKRNVFDESKEENYWVINGPLLSKTGAEGLVDDIAIKLANKFKGQLTKEKTIHKRQPLYTEFIQQMKFSIASAEEASAPLVVVVPTEEERAAARAAEQQALAAHAHRVTAAGNVPSTRIDPRLEAELRAEMPRAEQPGETGNPLVVNVKGSGQRKGGVNVNLAQLHTLPAPVRGDSVLAIRCQGPIEQLIPQLNNLQKAAILDSLEKVAVMSGSDQAWQTVLDAVQASLL